jgi:hypothetical protein
VFSGFSNRFKHDSLELVLTSCSGSIYYRKCSQIYPRIDTSLDFNLGFAGGKSVLLKKFHRRKIWWHFFLVPTLVNSGKVSSPPLFLNEVGIRVASYSKRRHDFFHVDYHRTNFGIKPINATLHRWDCKSFRFQYFAEPIL